ncbi:MerR family transcriptional regulator [Phenylobacterium sp.]|uniref:MerR family transcriptional regulator n=1 Tax=Phenylobacterium sp. TaxID=1871053 RepID=UPI0027375AFD|nr:MerR family transcriptional regulator [Phenylobacterium sp.]MDP3660673.1 MerR family transcriptional regulator [Phenylobacterium sp.]
MNASVNFLSPSEAALRLGISVKALRLYEERGLVSPGRTAAGWRAYGPDDLARTAEIVALRALGFSLAQVEGVLSGVADRLEPALAAHQSRLEGDLGQLGLKLDKVRGLRRELARGEVPSAKDLAGLIQAAVEPMATFDLPWPWGGERFAVRDVRPINYIVGPLGSGKTRLAKMLAEHLPDTVFLGLERIERQAAIARSAVEANAGLRERAEAALAWLLEDGARESDALFALVVGLEQDASKILVIDIIEQGLDEVTQQAVMAHLRKRGPGDRPVFIITRSSAILDLSATTPHEIAIFCPANHSPPQTVRLQPGSPGYEALASCLGPPEIRARTEGMIAWIPQRGSGEGNPEADPADVR